MFIAMNRFQVRTEFANAFEKRWRDRESFLSEFEGFMRFWLLRAADVEGVATFYSQIFRQPVGRHIIRVCDSMVCYIGGHESVVDAIQSKLGIGLGQTTADGRFTLLPVCCLGNCDKAPALMIDDDTFGDVQAAGVTQLLEGYP